jgi:hypothetical protein
MRRLINSFQALYYRGIARLELRQERGIGDVQKAIKADSRYFEAQYFCANYFYKQSTYQSCISNNYR